MSLSIYVFLCNVKTTLKWTAQRDMNLPGNVSSYQIYKEIFICFTDIFGMHTCTTLYHPDTHTFINNVLINVAAEWKMITIIYNSEWVSRTSYL